MQVLTQQLLGLHRKLVGPNNEYDWLPYLWLSYILVYFVPLTFTDLPLWQNLLAWVCGLATVALYFAAQTHSHWWLPAAMIALGTGITGFYSAGIILMFYGANMAGFIRQKRYAYLVFAGYAVCAAAISYLTNLPNFLLFVLWSALPWGIGNMVHRRNDLQHQTLKLSQAEAQAIARLQERERIRGDIHDILGQSLTAISLNMQVLRRAELPEATRVQMLEQTEQLAKQCLADARQTLHNEYQASLEEVIATSRIACLAKHVVLTVKSLPASLPSELSHALAQALRESITNSLKHSSGDQIMVSFQPQNKQLVLTIEDNGGGSPVHLGTGLTSMRARIEQMGGTVVFSHGWLTTIRVNL